MIRFCLLHPCCSALPHLLQKNHLSIIENRSFLMFKSHKMQLALNLIIATLQASKWMLPVERDSTYQLSLPNQGRWWMFMSFITYTSVKQSVIETDQINTFDLLVLYCFPVGPSIAKKTHDVFLFHCLKSPFIILDIFRINQILIKCTALCCPIN